MCTEGANFMPDYKELYFSLVRKTAAAADALEILSLLVGEQAEHLKKEPERIEELFPPDEM